MNSLQINMRLAVFVAAVAAAGIVRGQVVLPPDETLWRAIAAMRPAAPASQPYEEWFEAQLAHRRELVSRLRRYLTLYPGGSHRDEAVILELRSLYEIGCLSDGTLASLCRRAGELLAAPLSPVCEQEAAYWMILCRRGDRAASTQPAAEPLQALDAHLEAEYLAYVERHPTARRTPRLTALLFELYERRGDLTGMRKLADGLQRSFPQHATTEYCRGVCRRYSSLGERFELRLTTLSHGVVDSSALRGRPYLVVVWLADRAAATYTADEHTTAPSVVSVNADMNPSAIEEFRRSHPDFQVIGVPIADTAEEVLRSTERLRIPWPQHFDERGWAGEFVCTWGVRREPFLFIVDTDGVLRGATDRADWRETAASIAGD